MVDVARPQAEVLSFFFLTKLLSISDAEALCLRLLRIAVEQAGESFAVKYPGVWKKKARQTGASSSYAPTPAVESHLPSLLSSLLLCLSLWSHLFNSIDYSG